jgi:hypothetical protein
MRIEELLKGIDELLAIQAANIYDEYTRGMYNGMEMIRSMVSTQEPVYMEYGGELDKEAKARQPERYI